MGAPNETKGFAMFITNKTDAATVQDNLHNELSMRWPTIEFATELDNTPCGYQIRIEWQDGPTANDVKSIANQYMQSVIIRNNSAKSIRIAAANICERHNLGDEIFLKLVTKYPRCCLWGIGLNGKTTNPRESFQQMMFTEIGNHITV